MQESQVMTTVPSVPALEELESLDAPGWGSAFWTGAGVGVAVGALIWT